MLQRGRKSSASLVAIVPGSARLTPPATLSEAERVVFIDLVSACDPKHFKPSDLPLLTRYVETVAMSDHAGRKLRADVLKGRPSQWLSTQERLVKMMIVLARQLRLTVLTRTDPKTIGRFQQKSGPRPWEVLDAKRG